MSDATHKDPSQGWLIFFMVCFVLVVFGIGLVARFTYDANAPEPKGPSGGGHGMILPQDGDYAPHAARLPIV